MCYGWVPEDILHRTSRKIIFFFVQVFIMNVCMHCLFDSLVQKKCVNIIRYCFVNIWFEFRRCKATTAVSFFLSKMFWAQIRGNGRTEQEKSTRDTYMTSGTLEKTMFCSRRRIFPSSCICYLSVILKITCNNGIDQVMGNSCRKLCAVSTLSLFVRNYLIYAVDPVIYLHNVLASLSLSLVRGYLSFVIFQTALSRVQQPFCSCIGRIQPTCFLLTVCFTYLFSYALSLLWTIRHTNHPM